MYPNLIYTTIIPFTKKYYVMLKRRLYYTAITRAKKYLIMIGDFEAFRLSVNNTDYSRNTKLIEKINIKNLTRFFFTSSKTTVSVVSGK